MTGKTQLQGKGSEIARAAGKLLERSAEAQTRQVPMNRNPRSLLEHTSEMKRRGVHGLRDLVQSDPLRQPPRHVSLGRLDTLDVIGIRARASAMPSRPAASLERGFQHIRDELKRSDIGPEVFERMSAGGL